MTDDDKAAAKGEVTLLVRSGFYDADRIAEIVGEEFLDPADVDPDWLRAEIDQAFAEKHDAEASWPEVTDCDRLDQLFDALNQDGIVALQNAGYTQSDGLSDVTEAYEEAGGEDSDVTGYCFYHGQDLERVVNGGGLWIAFGDIGDDEVKGVAIGHRVKRAAEAKGFRVDWDGSVKTRLLLDGINWKRRSP